MHIGDMTVYEQPLNELVRVCLRLESLFLEADREAGNTSPSGTRHIITTIISLLQLLERPDLKAKMTRELSTQMYSLSRLAKAPGVDQLKLKTLLDQLDQLCQKFIESNSKIGQSLRQIEMLNQLRLHLSTPGGGCSFDTPLYHYWLEQPADRRAATIRDWLAEFDTIRLASQLILKLLREESRVQSRSAVSGFHQEMLDAQGDLRLIRVLLPKKTEAFPEISLNRHFMSVRFLIPTIKTRPIQLQEDLPFWLAWCSA